MSRISVSLSGIERNLLNRLAEANAAATLSSLRMATGSKINFPSDDPSTFVMLSGWQSQLGAVRNTMFNVTAASSIVTQTQTTLGSIRTQLNTIRTELLKDESRSLTAAQRTASQATIDTAITQINALAATEIDGRRILDGSADFNVSGRDSSHVADVKVYSTGGSPVTISGSITQAATQAELVHTGIAGAKIEFDATFTVTGDLGSEQFSVTANDLLSDVVTKINDDSHKTGVTASVAGNDLTLTSVNYGSNADIAITVSTGTFNVTGGNGDGTANGTDVTAEIGGLSYTGDGNQVTISQNQTRYTIEFARWVTGDFNPITVDGDALTFALSTDVKYRSTLAIPSLHSAQLGGLSGSLSELATGKALAGLDDKTSQAIRVVDEALGDLTLIEGTVDGFYNASITSASGLMSDLEDNLEAAIDDVNLVNDQEETQRLAGYLDLASNSAAGLAVLRQQQFTTVRLIQQIAGLL